MYLAGTPQTKQFDFETINLGACECKSNTVDDPGCSLPDREDWSRIHMGHEPHSANAETDDCEAGTSDSRGKSSKFQLLGEQASKEILKSFPASADIFHDSENFKNKFPELYWNNSLFEKIVPQAFVDVQKDWNKLFIAEMAMHRVMRINTFKNDSLPYYAPIRSAYLLSRIILEQNNNDIPACIDFVTNIINIVDKVIPKVNTLVIVSPPSSGKTFFVNSLLAMMWSVGRITNSTKSSGTFVFQDAKGKRAIEWNECLMIGKEFIETCKKIWEGDTTKVDVKFKSGQTLTRTPLFVTSNQDPWIYCPEQKKAFTDRCFYYKWTVQPWLKQVTHYPCPAAWYWILKNFKNDFWWQNVPETSFFNDADPDVVMESPHEVYFDLWLRSREQVTWDDEEGLDMLAANFNFDLKARQNFEI